VVGGVWGGGWGGGGGVKMLLLQKVHQAHKKSDLGFLRS